MPRECINPLALKSQTNARLFLAPNAFEILRRFFDGHELAAFFVGVGEETVAVKEPAFAIYRYRQVSPFGGTYRLRMMWMA
jgi:hypothetical protein